MEIKQFGAGSSRLISPVVEQEVIGILWDVEDHVNVGAFGEPCGIEESAAHPSVVEFFSHFLKWLALLYYIRWKIRVYVDPSPVVGQRSVLPCQPQYVLLHPKTGNPGYHDTRPCSGARWLCALSTSIGVGK